VLVVEDAPEPARLMQVLLEEAHYRTERAQDGAEALSRMARSQADLVITDLVMPGMNGLELVEELRRLHPTVPVILVTAHGSGAVAAEALRRGAASYVPKAVLHDELVRTVDSVLAVALERRERDRVLRQMTSMHLHFRLENDQRLVVPLVNFLQRAAGTVAHQVGETQVTQLGMALQEALLNSMHHGNLEVSSETRKPDRREWERTIAERLANPRYSERRVHFDFRLEDGAVTCVIRDEGPGFDVETVPDPTDPGNLLKVSGRGLFLIGAFMDSVQHNELGNEITMVKNLNPRRARSAAGRA
jgi:CheY-like chemotaxis protein